MGHIYVIRAENGLVKIGGSGDELSSRLGVLVSQCASALEWLGYIEVEDYMETEADLHHRYKPQRHHGEWFKLSENQLASLLERCSDPPFDLYDDSIRVFRSSNHRGPITRYTARCPECDNRSIARRQDYPHIILVCKHCGTRTTFDCLSES